MVLRIKGLTVPVPTTWVATDVVPVVDGAGFYYVEGEEAEEGQVNFYAITHLSFPLSFIIFIIKQYFYHLFEIHY